MVTPGNRTNRLRPHGRIILNTDAPLAWFCNPGTGTETDLIALSGAVKGLVQYDAIYLPRDASVEASTGQEVDIAEFK